MITTWIIIFIVTLESVIKQVREQKSQFGEQTPFLNDKLYLTKYHNKGALLNLGSKYSNYIKWLSIGLCGVCTAIYIITFGKKGKKLLQLGLAFLLGGAYSNTYDRMVRGYVIDYFGFRVKNERIRNIVFNISDFCIMIGSVIGIFGL